MSEKKSDFESSSSGGAGANTRHFLTEKNVTLKFLKFSFRADRPRYDHFNGRDYNYESFFRFSTITFFEFGYYHYYYSYLSLFLLHTTTLILSMFLYFLLFFDWYIYLLTTRYIFLFLKNFNHYLLSHYQVLNHCLFSLLSCCLECCVAYLVFITYIHISYYFFSPNFYIYIFFLSFDVWFDSKKAESENEIARLAA